MLRTLQSRIFLTSALLTVLSLGVAIYLVGVRVNREVEASLQSDIVATGALVEQLRTTRAENFAVLVRLVGDAPKLKAAVDTNDPPTVQDVAEDYHEQLHSHLLVVSNRGGGLLANVGATDDEALSIAALPSTREAMQGRERIDLLAAQDGILQLFTVPIALGVERPDVLGVLSVGFLLDDALAAELKAVTGSDIAFGVNGQILASTLPPELRPGVSELLTARSPRDITLGGQEFVALARPLTPGGPDSSAAGAPSASRSASTGVAASAAASGMPPLSASAAAAVILRSRTDQTRFLREINSELGATALVGVLLATLLSFAVARTITRPLAAITRVMRDVAATGDLTRKIAASSGRRWPDEDAQLLASTFNTLTDSVARFQREMSQKERLSSLGRLSTVIAHEIRNPLMIIKASLRTLRQPAPSPEAVREAVADIDDEVVRLNRVVNEVLDFARPIRFELAPTDLNALCRESANAAQASAGVPVQLDLAGDLPVVLSDGERLRHALVNLIVNARQAVEAQTAVVRAAAGGNMLAGTPEPYVTVSTRMVDANVRITVADTGRGIDPADLPKIFDPYFTTKRGGTGLGLPITKNIVEGLGGTLTVLSTVGRGTEIRLDLPCQRAGDASV